MKNILKYILLIVILASFSYILMEQWIRDIYWLSFTCLVLTTGGFLLIKNRILSWSFNKFFLVSVFMFLIYTPFTGRKETESLEKRTLTEFPKFRIGNVWKFLREYQDYFDDRFAFRNKCLELNGTIKLHVLHTSPVPSKLEIGKDNWLFSAGSDYVSYTSKPFTQRELKLIETNLELITLWLAERNIKYYFACAPVKARIYPEKMPAGLKQQCEFSKLDQLYKYLQGNKVINFIDMREELTSAKKIRDVYMKTDTHWNPYGAYLGYKKIMETMNADFPEIKVPEDDDYLLDSTLTDGGDLLMFMGLNKGIPFFNYHMKLKDEKSPIAVDSSTVPGFSYKIMIRAMEDSTNGLKIFVVRDSYTEFLKLYINTSFDRSFYAWMTNVPVSMVMHEKPDIVLHEMLEMFLVWNYKLPAEILADSVFMKKHAPDYAEISANIDLSLLVSDENP